MRFSEASIIHLPALKLEHMPLLLKHGQSSRIPSNIKPFRFIASWLADPTFQNVVCQAWGNSGEWIRSVKKFHGLARQWNEECFGNILKKKTRLLGRLEGINSKLSVQSNPFLHNLQGKLWKELDSILLQEEVFWFQKERCDCL